MLHVLVSLCLLASAHADKAVLGGYRAQPQLQNDAHVQEIAEFAVQQLAASEATTLELADILSVKTQLVAGTNYQFELELTNGLVYDLTVFESLNGREKQLTATKQLPARSNYSSSSSSSGSSSSKQSQRQIKASSPSSDGYRTVKMPMLDDGTMFAARETAQYLSQTSNSLYPFTVGEITSAAVKQDGQDESTYVVRVRLDQQSLPSATVDAQVSRDNMNSYKVMQITKPRYLSSTGEKKS
ncbi:hypothetical protein WJX84_008333 [Apatococcus fuscideae]|uniref:Cystatin domain-containing protein n=1 Tax=Apatococcus fuscideae TaxID=2026836 RepID=A0AAW1T878_9CHLO